jgi:hypothetical protein
VSVVGQRGDHGGLNGGGDDHSRLAADESPDS